MLISSLLIFFLPIFISLFLCIKEFYQTNYNLKSVVFACSIGTIIMLLCSLYGLWYNSQYSFYEISFSFLSINNLNLKLGIYSDIMSCTFASVIELISFIIYIYSIFYMNNDKHILRFYSLLSLFNLAVILFIFSPNLFQILLFWELISAVSYLLVGYYGNKNNASINSRCMFLINILGDIALFVAFLILSISVFIFSKNPLLMLLPFSHISEITTLLISSLNYKIYHIICFMLLFSAFVKSAQFPVNSWIINAMSAPVPISALIHSSTLVMAGAYLILRLFPLILSDYYSPIILIVTGISTSVITSLCAIFQNDIKKVLAYSTSSQLGLVFVSIGCYSNIVSIIFLLTHAFIKSLLFMSIGPVIKSSKTQDVLLLGNLRQYMPVTALGFLVGAIALSGIGFCGFNAKYMIAKLIVNNLQFITFFGIIGALTTLYIFRLYFMIFEGNNDLTSAKFTLKYLNISNCTILFLVFIIVVSSLFLPSGRICSFYLVNILMVIIAFYLFRKRTKTQHISFIKNILSNGLYIDKFYYFCEHYIYRYISSLVVFIDKFVFNGIERLIKKYCSTVSDIEFKIQNNNFQTYMSYGIWLLIFVIGLFFTGCYFIQNLFGV